MLDLRSETKKQQDEARKKGKERRKKMEEDPKNSGSPKDDGYDDMTPGQKEAYKEGYRG